MGEESRDEMEEAKSLIEICEAFESGGDVGFNEVVSRAIEGEVSKWDLAHECQVAASTIMRWCEDTRPHGAMQTYVVARIGELLDN